MSEFISIDVIHHESLTNNVTHCVAIISFLITVKSAKLKDTGSGFFSKGDPYVEMTVDGQPPRKTEVVKKTWHPSWNEHFTV